MNAHLLELAEEIQAEIEEQTFEEEVASIREANHSKEGEGKNAPKRFKRQRRTKDPVRQIRRESVKWIE